MSKDGYTVTSTSAEELRHSNVWFDRQAETRAREACNGARDSARQHSVRVLLMEQP